MSTIDALDDLGIALLIRPMTILANLPSINTVDDLGIVLVCHPLRHLHRFAAFLLDVDLSADESAVSSMPSTSVVSSTPSCSLTSTSLPSTGRVGAVKRRGNGRAF